MAGAPESPPTSPGTMASPRSASLARVNLIIVGMAINAMPVGITCFAVPLAMDSNIWPIAGVFWCVLAVPIAGVVGVVGGWTLRRLPRGLVIGMLAVSGLALSVVTGVIISQNR